MERSLEGFWFSFYCGLSSVLYNIDHFICAFLNNIPLFPLKGLYGCKASPEATFIVALYLAWFAGTWWIGLVSYELYRVIRSTSYFD